jgi:hypothetical protein
MEQFHFLYTSADKSRLTSVHVSGQRIIGARRIRAGKVFSVGALAAITATRMSLFLTRVGYNRLVQVGYYASHGMYFKALHSLLALFSSYFRANNNIRL